MNIIFNIWMQPVYARINVGGITSLYFSIFLIPATSLIIAGLLFFLRPDKVGFAIFGYALLFSIGVLMFFITFGWYFLLIQNIRLQYSPTNAQIVPEIKKYLKIAVILPILFFASLSFVVGRAVLDHYSVLPTFATVLFMMSSAMLIRTMWAVLPLILSSQALTLFRFADFDAIDQKIAELLAIPAFAILLITVPPLVYAVVNWVFASRRGGRFKNYELAVKRQAAFAGKKLNENRGLNVISFLFFRWMKVCVSPTKKESRAENYRGRLIAFALGPRLHWTTNMGQVLVGFGGGIAISLIFGALDRPGNFHLLSVLAPGLAWVFIAALPILFCIVLHYTLFQTRIEQGLFNLTEKSMTQLIQDKVLTNYLLRQFFILYGISAAAALVLGRFVLDVGILALTVTCLFPLILSITRNHAKMKTGNDHSLLKNLLICLMIFAVGMVYMFNASANTVWWYCVLVYVSTSTILIFKLKTNVRTRMFPVGRAA